MNFMAEIVEEAKSALGSLVGGLVDVVGPLLLPLLFMLAIHFVRRYARHVNMMSSNRPRRRRYKDDPSFDYKNLRYRWWR